jgi:D-3-phosphoglycerate dehydrogenase
VAIDVSEEVLHILRNEPFKNAVNMPPVPANVLNVLQPYFHLGEKLGRFVGKLTESAIEEIIVNYAGELSDVDTSPLTRHIVKGILVNHLADEVNIVNAMHMAKLREVNIVVQKATTAKTFTNLVTVTLKSKKEEKTVAGTLLSGYGERIVQIDQYPVDIAPEGTMLLISHNDKPGIIGRVGTLLGNNQVNIASMQVGRKVIGGSAIMVLTIDKEAPSEVLKELSQLADLLNVKAITL